MPKTKVEKIAGIDEQITQLEAQRKKLLQQHKEQERKDRTKRLCKRAGLLESMLPDTLKLTDEQFKNFLERTTGNEYGRKTLANIVAKAEAINTTKPTETAVQGNVTPTAKPAEAAQQSGTSGNATERSGGERPS